MSQQFSFLCSRGQGRGRSCEVVTLGERQPPLTEPLSNLGQCCLCHEPAQVIGPRGSAYCAAHGRCNRCGTSVAEMRLEKPGGSVYLCPCFWDWDPEARQRRLMEMK